MATVASLFVKIGAEVKDFVNGMKQATNSVDSSASNISKSASQIRSDMDSMVQNADSVAQDLVKSYQSMGTASAGFNSTVGSNMRGVEEHHRRMASATKQAERAMRDSYMQLAESGEAYVGRTDEFMKKIEQLGAIQKRTADQMIANDARAKASFLQNVGEMLNVSSKAGDMMQVIAKHGSAIQQLNTPFLAVTRNIDNMTRSMQPAAVALSMLGPNASMYELQKLTKTISFAAMNTQLLQFIALMVTIAELKALVKLSNEIDGRLIPAFERFKSVWMDALEPFVHAFTTAATAVVNLGTKIGQLHDRLSDTHPQLAQMLDGFLALIPPLTMILAPLGIGIGLMKSFGVSSAMLWAAIRPLVTAFASVIGTVVAVSAVIVTATAVINNMWKASESLRDAVSNAFSSIKSAILEGLQPIMPLVNQVKQVWDDLVQSFTGGGDLTNSVFRTMGDGLAEFINKAVQVLIPPLKSAFNLLAQGIVFAADLIKGAWELLKTVAEAVFPAIQTIYQGLGQLIQSVSDALVGIFGTLRESWQTLVGAFTQGEGTSSGAFNRMKDTLGGFINDAVQNLLPVLKQAFNIAAQVIQVAGQIIEGAIKLLTPVAEATFPVIGELVRGMSQVIGSVFQAVSGIFASIKTVFDQLVQAFSGGSDSSQSSFEGIRQKFSDVANELASNLIPFLKSVFDGLAKGIEWVGQLISTAIQAIVPIAQAVFPVIAEIVKGAWDVITAVTQALSPIWEGIKSAFRDVASVFMSGSSESSFSVSTMAQKITDVLGSVAQVAIPLLKGAFDILVQVIQWAGPVIGEIFRVVGEVAKAVFPVIGEIIKGLWEVIQATVDALVPIFDGLKNVWNNLVSAFSSGGQSSNISFQNVGQVISQVVTWAAQELLPWLQRTFDQLAEGIRLAGELIGSVLDVLAQAFGYVMPVLIEYVQKAWSWITSDTRNTWDQVVGLIQAAWQLVSTTITGALDIIIGALNLFIGIFTGDWGRMWDGVVQVAGGALDILTGVFQGVADLWNLFTGKSKEHTETLKTNTISDFNAMKTGTTTAANGTYQGVLGSFQKMNSEGTNQSGLLKTGVTGNFLGLSTKSSSIFGGMQTDLVGKSSLTKADVNKQFAQMSIEIANSSGQAKVDAINRFMQMRQDVVSQASGMRTNVNTEFNGLSSDSSSIFDGLNTNLVSKMGSTKTEVGGIASSMSSNTSSIFSGFKNDSSSIFGGISSNIFSNMDKSSRDTNSKGKNIASAANTHFSAAMRAGRDQFRALTNSINAELMNAYRRVTSIINSIVSAFRGMRISIPKFKLPHVSIAIKYKAVKGGPDIPYPSFSVSWYEKGGIFTGPSVIGVGEGTANEAVVPLSGSRMRPFAQEIAKQMGGTSSGGDVNIHVENMQVRDDRDIKDIAQELYRLQQSNLRARGAWS